MTTPLTKNDALSYANIENLLQNNKLVLLQILCLISTHRLHKDETAIYYDVSRLMSM